MNQENPTKQDINDLPADELLEQLENMIKWWHYDPMCSQQPSSFNVDDLRAEVARRMQEGIGHESGSN